MTANRLYETLVSLNNIMEKTEMYDDSMVAKRKMYAMREKVVQDLKQSPPSALAAIILGNMSDADVLYHFSKMPKE